MTPNNNAKETSPLMMVLTFVLLEMASNQIGAMTEKGVAAVQDGTLVAMLDAGDTGVRKSKVGHYDRSPGEPIATTPAPVLVAELPPSPPEATPAAPVPAPAPTPEPPAATPEPVRGLSPWERREDMRHFMMRT